MAYGKIDRSKLTAIANAIRSKTETSSLMTPDEMVAAINAINDGGDIEHLSWHQCPELVRKYLAAASAAYPTAAADFTVINENDYGEVMYQNIPDDVSNANSKPIGYTIDGITFYDNEPGVATPFVTANKAGTLTALDWLRWYNTTLAPAFPKPADRPNKPSYPRGKNCRDLGGWACDGGTVKYGLLIRGSEPNPADRELMVDKIGIKTEVQLLPMYEQDDGFVKTSAWGIDWAGNDTENISVYSIIDSKVLWKKLLEPIMDSVIHSKPVYFHCGVGADRTGVMAMMLEGLLGVSRANIDMDFELTNFALGWKIVNGKVYRSRAQTSYKDLMTAWMSDSTNPLVGGLTDSFRNRCISHVLSCGIKIDKINAFRAAMIDGNPETITITVPTHTISKSGANVTFDNQITSVNEYDSYSVGVTPNSSYVISDVSVTMGGTDITSQVFSGTPTIRRVSVTNNLSHCATSNTSSVIKAGTAYTATITAASGYTLDGATVSIMMGNTDITASSYSNGAVRITSVTDNISITITAVVEQTPIRYYNVVNNLSNCSTNNASASISDGSSYSATITAASGYTLDGVTVSITMGGADVSNYYSNGTINIPSVNGDVVITINAVPSARENVYDDSAATLNARIRGVGAVGPSTGRMVTGTIDISNISTLTIEGVTEVANSDNSYARIGLYSSSVGGETDYVGVYSNGRPTYSFDVASLKTQYPTATHARIEITLTYPNNMTASDVANLAIYAS